MWCELEVCAGDLLGGLQVLLGGPEGPEPALGFSKIWSPTSTCREATSKTTTTKAFAQPARGSRDFFVTYFRNVTCGVNLRCAPETFLGGASSLISSRRKTTQRPGSRWLCARPLASGGLGEASVRTLDSDSAYLLRLWTLGTLSTESLTQHIL